MHETLQRKICRVAFLALCVLPTLALAGSIGWRLWPGRFDEVLASLSRQLNVRVTAERITTPKPGLWRVEGLTLSDPESRTPIAELDWLEFRGNQPATGRCRHLHVLRPAVFGSTIDRLLRSDWPSDWRVAVDEITLGGGQQKTAAWQNLRARLSSGSGQDARRRTLTVSQNEGAASLSVERRRDTPDPQSIVQLNTGDQSVAWGWIARLGGASASENLIATLRGSTQATLSEHQNSLTTTGALTGLRPNTVLGHDGLTLASPLTAEIDRLQIVDGRVTALQANCTAHAGTIGHDLVLAAARRLGCRATPLLENLWPRPTDRGPFEPIKFDRLAFTVTLDANGCRLSSDALLASAAGPLLLAPTRPAPVEALLHLAAPAAERYHPAAPAARKLANRLPLAAIK